MNIKIEKIFYFPVKSLSFNKLYDAKIKKNIGIKNDRIFSFIFKDKEFENIRKKPSKRKPSKFITLKNSNYLNFYNFFYVNEKLVLKKNNKEIFNLPAKQQYQLDNISEKFMLEEKKLNKTIKLIKNKNTPFFDTMINFKNSELKNSISLINLNSIESFSKKIGEKIEYKRFRGNIYVKGIKAWNEKNFVGKKIKINNCNFKVISEIPRCSVTNLIPNSNKSNLNIPLLLKKSYGHINMGIYLYPLNDGNIRIKDKVKIF